MLIELEKGKQRLATLWFVSSGILFSLLFLQTILGHYGEDVTKAWGWILPTIMPTLSLIIGVFVRDNLEATTPNQMVSKFVYTLAFYLSVSYLITIFLTIISQPFSSSEPVVLMEQSNIYLGPFQGLVSASIGIFFTQKEKTVN